MSCYRVNNMTRIPLSPSEIGTGEFSEVVPTMSWGMGRRCVRAA
jgi:hypothetical protein